MAGMLTEWRMEWLLPGARGAEKEGVSAPKTGLAPRSLTPHLAQLDLAPSPTKNLSPRYLLLPLWGAQPCQNGDIQSTWQQPDQHKARTPQEDTLGGSGIK